MAGDLEAFSSVGRFSDGLVEHVQCLSVFPSHGLDTTGVVEIFAELVVGLSFGEGALFNQVVGGFEVAVAEIVSEEKVENGALADFIAPDAGSVKGFQQLLSDVLIASVLFVNPREVVVQECTVIIEVPSVG